jgi:hypothetical protein
VPSTQLQEAEEAASILSDRWASELHTWLVSSA